MTGKWAKMSPQVGSASKIVPRRRQTQKKWLVAVDPFSEVELQNIWALVHGLSENSDSQLMAGYILAPASFNWTGEFSGPWMKRYTPIAKARMEERVPDEGIQKVIIPCRSSGTRASVKALVSFAKKHKVNCIVILTHGRQGLERLAMGSFAETLILTSPVPVLVLNPAHQLPVSIRKILVPTDLSQKNEKFALSAASYAKTLGAELLLYHKEIDPLDPVIQQGVYSLGGGWVSIQEFMDEDRVAKTRQIEKMEKAIAKKGVVVDHFLDSSPGNLIEGIENAAQKHGADMISILTQAGSWSAALLGSVARRLVRSASIPILVQR